jgi:putative hydrolase of the HAD superfamily
MGVLSAGVEVFAVMEIEAITFDVGGTLIEPWPSVGHVYAQVAAAHGAGDFDAEMLNRQFAAAWRSKANFDYSRPAWAELVAKTFTFPGKARPEISFFDALYELFAHPGAWRIYDDVIPALESLCEAGLKLAIISNWDERLRPLLGKLRLDRYFQFLAISCEIGFHKPSPVIFQEATRRLGVAGNRTIHIGDSRVEDCQGATQVGLQSFLLNRRGRSDSRGELSSLSSLMSLLMAPSPAKITLEKVLEPQKNG